jgi:hypothetical protein
MTPCKHWWGREYVAHGEYAADWTCRHCGEKRPVWRWRMVDFRLVERDLRWHDVARYPDRRAHPFESPWPTATMTKCERCGVRYGEHPREAVTA